MVNKNGDLIHLRIKRTKENKHKLFIKKHGKAIKIEEAGGIENLVNVAKNNFRIIKTLFRKKV
jgi:hypothetical protein